jgi:tRNA(fMet)-specific endonuclease VapC
LKRIDRLQGEFDMLIGSTALAYGLALVTRNTRHFADMLGMLLENWVDGEASDPTVG